MAELGDTHELSDARKLLKASRRVDDELGEAVAKTRALKFAQKHGTDLGLVIEIVGIGEAESSSQSPAEEKKSQD